MTQGLRTQVDLRGYLVLVCQTCFFFFFAPKEDCLVADPWNSIWKILRLPLLYIQQVRVL